MRRVQQRNNSWIYVVAIVVIILGTMYFFRNNVGLSPPSKKVATDSSFENWVLELGGQKTNTEGFLAVLTKLKGNAPTSKDMNPIVPNKLPSTYCYSEGNVQTCRTYNDKQELIQKIECINGVCTNKFVQEDKEGVK
ncbi:hypothetical protein EXS72_02850 [Candidatus Pacearchaeota archaeon]|nr:hypothetical protein [Candidatus Pacearchaeota archaeon]